MILLQFNIRNPWSDTFQNLGYRFGNLPIQHKCWEVQLLRGPDIVQFMLNITHRQDHAGINFELGLLGYTITFKIYDSRHWDWLINSWKVHE